MTETKKDNIFLRALFKKGSFSEDDLKRLYRKLCKETHPDVLGDGGVRFLEMNTQYFQAKEVLEKLQSDLGPEKIDILKKNARKELFLNLEYYTAAGLHSSRIRIRKELRERNLGIVKQIILWAKYYDQRFIPIFLNYNKTYLQRFDNWKKNDLFSKGRKYLLTGFRSFLDFHKSGSLLSNRMSRSFLEDALFNFTSLGKDERNVNCIQLCSWLLTELVKTPALYRKRIGSSEFQFFWNTKS